MHLHGHNIWVLQEGACNALPGSGEVAPPATSSIPASATSAQPGGPSTTSYPASYTPASAMKRDDESDLRIHFDVNGKRDTPPPNSCWDGSIVHPEVRFAFE